MSSAVKILECNTLSFEDDKELIGFDDPNSTAIVLKNVIHICQDEVEMNDGSFRMVVTCRMTDGSNLYVTDKTFDQVKNLLTLVD